MNDVRPDLDAFDDESPTTVTDNVAADPLAFLLGGAPDRKTTADDTRSTQLEVHHTWRGMVLDTVHARRGALTGGEATGHRWKVLGTDIAWVPRPLAMVLPFAPPMLSEVDTRPRADLPLSGPGVPEDRLLDVFRQRADGGWDAVVQPGWDVVVEDGDTVMDLPALAAAGQVRPTPEGAAIAVPDGGQVSVGIGEVELHARIVPAARKAPAGPWFDRVDLLFLGLIGLTGFVGACFGMLVVALPGSPSANFTDLLDGGHVVLHETVKPPEDPQLNDVLAGAQSEERAKGEDGKTGLDVKEPEPGSGRPKANEDRVTAMNAGLLGAMADAGVADGFGGGMDRSMLDGIGNGMLGAKGVERGTGLGSRGSGLGGNGTVDGIGGVGVGCEPGRPCQARALPGSGYGGWTKGTRKIDVGPGDPILIGNIDKAAVEKVIKANLAKFRYCYQRQLQRDPNLSGKSINRFVIARDGTVSSSATKVSTISPAVDACLEQTMARLQFPEPKGGGIAIVSYPFVFNVN